MTIGQKVEHVYNPGTVGVVIPTGTRPDGTPGAFSNYINVQWPGRITYHHSARFLKLAI